MGSSAVSRLYRRGWGWLLDGMFLLLIHAGRKTGRRYSTIAMVLSHDPRTPYRTRLLAAVLGWGDLRSDTAVRDFAGTRPFVSLWPLASGQQLAGGEKRD